MRITKNCEICNLPFSFDKYRINQARFCSRKCANIWQKQDIQPLAERFWSKVKIGPEEECWDWQASLHTSGVPQFSYQGKPKTASRIAYSLTYGGFAKELFVCHYCDRPICVNPNHLWLGTNTDNYTDRMRKGRCDWPVGEENGHSKLTETEVA